MRTPSSPSPTRPHLRLLALATVCAALATLPTAVEGAAEGIAARPEPRDEQLALQAIELTNAEREKCGLPPLKAVDALNRSAWLHARDMALNHFFSHGNREGLLPWDRAALQGYDHCRSENIAEGQRTAAEVVDGWMSSKGHRGNIVSPEMREMGVGVDRAAGGPLWVQVFGVREEVFPVIINGEAMETKDPAVKLYLYGQGVIQKMRLSNHGRDFTPWEPFQSRKEWRLEPGTGPRTITVELQDGERNVRSVSDTILLALRHDVE